MSRPEVSVVMPVYNAERYLKKAIDSILKQSLSDLELITVNDCSTDGSTDILNAYTDTRLIKLRTERNSGVVAAANMGLAAAQAPFTAVMHADDIAHPDRLAKQVQWLHKNHDYVLVGSFIQFIDEHDRPTGHWDDDQATISFEQIKKRMLLRNCLAHPTVMLRTQIYQQYKYHRNQQAQEDYDLWLRLIADGYKLGKIPEPLLQYRRHGSSITGTVLRKSNPFFKQADCKWKFLKYQWKQKKWNGYAAAVLAGAAYDAVMGVGKEIKKRLVP